MPTHSQRSAFTSGCYLALPLLNMVSSALRTILTLPNVGAACSSILSHSIVQLMAKVFPLSFYLFSVHCRLMKCTGWILICLFVVEMLIDVG